MPLEYETDYQLKELTEISSEYLDWFLKLNARLHYAEARADGKATAVPESFTSWLSDMREEAALDTVLLENLNTRYERLVVLANMLLTDASTSGNPPAFDKSNELAEHYEKFMDTLRRAEKELIFDKNGIDELTGLRKPPVLEKDLEREMQRLSRQGKPFSLAIARLDYFDQIKAEEGSDIDRYLKHISKLIKKSLRSFDDAYRTGENEFVLALKQADVTGGIRALERLKEFLEMNVYDFSSPKLKSNMVSLSCCVAEAVADGNVNDLLESIRSDLDRLETGDDTVLEHFELSPLERFMKSQ